MAQAPQNRDLTERFIEFYRNYYREEIGTLAQQYPKEKRSLYIDYDDLYRFDAELADDYITKPGQYQEYAEEALRLFDLPADVKLGQAHVRMRNLPDTVDIRNIRVNDDHIGTLIGVQGIVRKATDVRPKITEAAFECQRCGTMSYIPQGDGGFQEPHECQGCERQGPFRIDFDQSNFVDSQKLRVQESPEGLRGGETPQSIDINLTDDVTGEVTAGDHVTAVGILHIEQQTSGNEKTPVFDYYMEGISLAIEDEEFEDMEITDEDVAQIVELSNKPDIYEEMTDSVAPAIYGYDQEKLAMILQLFSGVTKHLPDGSRIRGDLHMLLIGDPGTGKCVTGDTRVTLADGRDVPIRELVESNLDDPKPIDDGVWDSANFEVPSLAPDGTLTSRQATKVWKREAPDHLLRIRTNTGRELTATPSHPLFIRDEGMTAAVRSDELTEGEFVAAPRSLPMTGTDDLAVEFRRSKSYNAVRLDLPDEWTPWLARLVGYIVAEGYVEQRDDATGFVSVTNNDREVLDDVADAFDRLGLNYFERSPHDGKSAREIICGSGEFVSFLANLSPSLLAGSDSQRIPEAVVSASSETGRAFVRAFIEGEGHVSATQREITVASMSRELLEDVRTLLLASGISSQLHPRHNGSYRLRISGDDFARYVARIGFITERKSVACDEYAAVEENTNSDLVPAGGELRELRETLGLTQADCGLPRSTYQHYERGDRNPSRESLSRVVSSFEDALRTADSVGSSALADGGMSVADHVSELRSLVDGDIGWERIDSIERVEPAEKWVYDLEVEGTHSYVSNGLVSHNSQMLSYIRNIAPRSVYTSGKGSSSAGLTAAAVRDDFGDGQQWTLEAGALVLADKGIAAVDELDKMRCVTGDSLVHLADGGIKRIRDLAHDAACEGSIEELPNGRTIRNVDAEAWTMTEDGRLVTRPVTAIHEYDAPDELTQITLQSGEQLTAIHDHPFITFENGERVEKPAADVSPGDWVYVPCHLSPRATDGGVLTAESTAEATITATEDELSPAFGAILGYLSGDGNVYYNREAGSYGIRFTNKEEELLADFEQVCRDTFGVEPVRPPSEQRDDGVETVRLPGREYADAVLDAGMNLEIYDGKAFPAAVSEASLAAKAAFVRAMADSEGCVDTDSGNVKISSSSYELLLGIKSLLLEFGVTTQIQHRERSGKRNLYVLAVTAADSLRRFNRHIGFTLERKQSALDEVCESVSGDRTILDVIPNCGGVLSSLRESLRLHVSECGLVDSTYCNFENEDANISFSCARTVLDAFESRMSQAESDVSQLSEPCDWATISIVKERYHVSQSELAVGTSFSQQQISRLWGTDDELRAVTRGRLREIVESVADTDLESIRRLVRGDVKWRRVKAVETVDESDADDRIRLLKHELADLLGVEGDAAVEHAQQLLDHEPRADDWSELRSELERHGVSFADIARDLDVAGSTVSRWFNGVVETDRFTDVVEVANARFSDIRSDARRLLDAIGSRSKPKVYDLTVEGTHNFVANGMVVHNSEDRSAMHEALEQQQISVSKAGINATLKSRCSLLGAANPKYGRFDQYESIGEQIDLEPALISRFDLIFTVTDNPDPDTDSELAEHILKTNYAGELNTQRTNVANSEFTEDQIDAVTDEVAPTIDAELLRKYIAYAKRTCYPTMTEEAKNVIRDFYVDFRARGADEDAPVPVTARKLEALVRLGEASARVRLSDKVTREDAERVTSIVESCLRDIGMDPETGEFDADIVETGRSKTQRDRIKNLLELIRTMQEEYEEGAPHEEVVERANTELNMDEKTVIDQLEKLKMKGDIYEPRGDVYRAT
ncbi:helix-turn-helix domain-containing protein [Haloferax mediterranei ATCC 33500]|uniref:DNA helicase n=1 Tax=Haloferax mediterranei (strain ATCC 33500 / DSM 1411 / JCM 8866 / NBRC 14739 / NCIMB 2177 / R-4) TaxID=523841 RepID=I3R155_HALMT|nr:LAGLIDADG family homing endonuclease [Haloferax mediterranei]AFK17965.1 replicative DNA helicase / cell division control protein 21 /MCM [Haloferax mediterranei ATCC 33500]AHZ22613.1 ATPase [Haloferax mediterranei ATCC 33500]EMA02757.1 replicative DNA helicase / cell division control protein 21 /MCM [Haloferax mediterranei ATCC 33500]MDX5988058.1 LAGLIDADG family homing endonuclease [Haloferax mediterranei ATCC 33500]QCQ74517.1 helix-turn-helix domain-containing protein [Haloferax mediterra